MLRHHEHRLTELQNALKTSPLSAHDALTVLFRRPMDGHQISFAIGEAVAHLNYLWHQGIAKRERHENVWKFSLA
ncbi:MAG: hypothetical protein HC848_01190 [Limnobacter sp.]|nr:hypothetical protein [Limnobacter sp.]